MLQCQVDSFYKITMTLAHLIKEHLKINGIVENASGWKCYIGKLPDSTFAPDNAVALIEQPAQPVDNDSRYESDGIPLLIGSLKIIIRGIDYKITMRHFEELCRSLDLITNSQIVDEHGKLTTIQTCIRQGGIQYQGYCSANRRHIATVTYAINIT